MEIETKDLEPVIEGIKEIKAEQKTAAIKAEDAKADIGTIKKEVTDTKTDVTNVKTDVEAIKTETTELKSWQAKKDEADKKNQEWIDKQVANGSRKPLANGGEVKSFNQIIGDTIEANKDRIRNWKKGDNLIMDMMPEYKEVNKEGVREVKAVGDMSISANFPAATVLYQDVRPLIQSPYNRVWLSDVLPSGTSNGTQLLYPKENGGEGGAAVWEDPTTDKPQIDFDLTSETAYFKWIAGIVIVDRESLDDIPFLNDYIQTKMLISLKTAENAFILNGTSAAKAVPGLLTVASPYNGDYSDRVDRIIDAAYGQIVDATNEFYQGTTAVLRPRDAVKIGLNKASGSGEYDLPAGSVAFVNGKLTIGGLDVVPTTQMAFDTFLAFDRAATMFVKRMQPELRLFEDATLAKKNKVMFRIEERATLAIFNNAAIVKGVLQLS